MNVFGISSVILLVLAALFIVVPVAYFHRASSKASSGQLSATARKELRLAENVAIFKDRLEELDTEKKLGNLTDESYTQLVAELENTLLGDTESLTQQENEQNGQASSTGAYFIACFSVLFIVALSIGVYSKYGAYEQVSQAVLNSDPNSDLSIAKKAAENGDISALLNQLHAKLKASPNNIDGWGLLARSSMNVQNYSLAIDAFGKVIELLKQESTDDRLEQTSKIAVVYGLLAQAQYYESQGKMTQAVTDSLDQALSLNKDEINALSLLAIDSFTSGKDQQAIDYWQRILTISPNHSASDSIKMGIVKAQENLGIPVLQSNEGEGSVTADSVVSLKVNVSLSKMILKDLRPEDTVFIFAKRAQANGSGPNIPLAASKHTVADLPVVITLDDTKAMSPMAKLSDVDSVIVVARVSKTGNPIAQNGDFQTVSNIIELKNNSEVKLEIDQLVNK
jgi:cytochrome c-type biogenesis protein CcmH